MVNTRLVKRLTTKYVLPSASLMLQRAWKRLTRNVVERQEVVSFDVVWKRGRSAANSCDTGLMLQWASGLSFRCCFLATGSDREGRTDGDLQVDGVVGGGVWRSASPYNLLVSCASTLEMRGGFCEVTQVVGNQ